MHLVNKILSRQYGLRSSLSQQRISLEFAFDRFQTVAQYAVGLDTADDTSAPLALTLCGSSIAIASEYGYVYILDAETLRPRKLWHAHRNAIFDLKSRPGHSNHVMTASGDQSLTLWDTDCIESNQLYSKGMDVYSVAKAHLSSIKSISFMDANIVASGARDGMVKIWDIRCSEKAVNVLNIVDAHKSKSTMTTKSKRAPRGGRGRSKANVVEDAPVTRSVPSNSVTVVLFQPDRDSILFSAGANDGSIKMWDIRKLQSSALFRGETLTANPLKAFAYQGKGYSAHGFTSLAFDDRKRIYGSCTDHHIHCYDTSSTKLVSSFAGAHINNFTRCKTLGDHLVSGSTRGAACVWPMANVKSFELNEKETNVIYPSFTLPQFDEVTAIETDPLNYCIYTSSDDQKLTKWALFDNVAKKKSDGCNDMSSKPVTAERFVPKDAIHENTSEPIITCEVSPPTANMTTTTDVTPPTIRTNSVSSSNSRTLSSLQNWLTSSVTLAPQEERLPKKEESLATDESDKKQPVYMDGSLNTPQKRKKENRTSATTSTADRPRAKKRKQLFSGNRKISEFFTK